MPKGPLGGPRPLARCDLGVQVTASGDEFTESELTRHIQNLDSRFSKERREGRSSAVMTVENGRVIANGSAAVFKVGTKVITRDQMDISLDIFEDYFGDRIRQIAITITD